MRYGADWTNDYVHYYVDCDYSVNTWSSKNPPDYEIEVTIDRLYECRIEDGGKKITVGNPEALPDCYYEDIIMEIEKYHLNNAPEELEPDPDEGRDEE